MQNSSQKNKPFKFKSLTSKNLQVQKKCKIFRHNVQAKKEFDKVERCYKKTLKKHSSQKSTLGLFNALNQQKNIIVTINLLLATLLIDY